MDICTLSIQQHFISFINFTFPTISKACLDPDGDIYAAMSNGNIAVWINENEKAWLQCLIVPPIDPLNIKWIYNTKLLAIMNEKICIIWDTTINKGQMRFGIKDRVCSIVKEDELYIVIYENKQLELINATKGKLIDYHTVWIHKDKLFYRSTDGRFLGSVVENEEFTFRNIDEIVRKKFFKNNKNLSGFTVVSSNFRKNIPNLKLPPSLVKYFHKIDFVIIHSLTKHILYQMKSMTLITTIGKKPSCTVIQQGTGIIIHDKKRSIIQTADKDVLSTENFLRKKLSYHVLHTLPEFENAPDYIFRERYSLEYTQLNKNMGYLLESDDHIHHILDLVSGESNYFKGNRFYKNSRVLIDEKRKFILEWRWGSSPPQGQLIHRSLIDNQTKLIYNKDQMIRYREDDFLDINNSEVNSKLIVREWHSIVLELQYQKINKDRVILSRSQLYHLIDHISRSERAASLTFKIKFVENLIGYGDIDLNGRKFYGINPLWIDDDKSIVTCHFDNRCYIWSKDSDIPEYSFDIGIPARIVISKRNIALITFSCRKRVFSSREGIELESIYPHAQLIVYDRYQKKHFSKIIVFPTHITQDVLTIETEGEGVQFQLPSTVDVKLKIIYNYIDGKFFKINPSKFNRYWHTNSSNTKILQTNIGVEYIVDPHPEIKRELHFRPFVIFIDELVRRADDLTILSGLKYTRHRQLSTDDELSSHLAAPIELPFSHNRLLKVYVLKHQGINPDRLILLDAIDKTPDYISHSRQELDNRRGRLLLDKISKDNQKHSANGILFSDYSRART